MGPRSLPVFLAVLATVLFTWPGSPAAAESAIPESTLELPGERSTATGAWGGRRPVWEARGVAVGLDSYQDLMSVLHGGVERGTAGPGLLEAALALDMDALAHWKDARVFVRGIAMYGEDVSALVGALNAPSNLANSVATTRLFEAWLERGFVDDSLSVLVGLYAVETEFDVKETAGLFMNGGFGTGIDLSQSGLNGPCTFPTSCFGMRIAYATPGAYARLAVLDGVAGDPDDPRGTHVRLGGDDGALLIGEIGYQPDDAGGRFLRAALGAWHYTTEFDDLLAVDAAGDPRRRHGTQGVYALLEGDVCSTCNLGRDISGFLRVGMADQRVNPVRYYVGAGLVGAGMIPGRADDTAGIAVSVPVSGEDYRQAQRLAGTPVDRHEAAIELAYRWQVSAWFGLQLDAQYIVNPGMDPGLDDAQLLGMRMQFTF